MNSVMWLLAHALAVVLTVVLPLQGVRRYRLLAAPDTSPADRRALVRQSLAIKWALVPPTLVLATMLPAGLVWAPTPTGWWLFAELVVAVAAGALVLQRRLRSPRHRARIAHAAAHFAGLLPRTPAERRTWIAVALTAGITEELAYRGFLLAYLTALAPDLATPGTAIAAGVVFGLVHLYQGWRGVLGTGVLGCLFALLYPDLGLVALMALHTLIDLRLLLLPPDLPLARTPTDHPDKSLTAPRVGSRQRPI